MKYAYETIAGMATAPGAVITSLTPVAGNSFRIRDSARARLVDINQGRQVGGLVRVTSPLLHDNVVGITQSGAGAGLIPQFHSLMVPQELTPQDTLTVAMTGSAVAGDVELTALHVLYEDLAGICAMMISPKEVSDRAIELLSMRVTVTGTAIGWTGDVAITALDDQLKANQEYAWLGGSVQVGAIAMELGIVSPDWGNLRIGCPMIGSGFTMWSRNYHWKRATELGLPLIPVFNASQKDNVVASILCNENFGAVTMSINLVRLKGRTKI